MNKLGLKIVLICGLRALVMASVGDPILWNSNTVELKVNVASLHAATSFPFKNISDHDITITEIAPSCGCTHATSSEKTIHPGHEGQIEASMDLAGLEGIQEKEIRVFTSEKPRDPDILKFRVIIPISAVIDPRFVSWQMGAPPTRQAVSISAGESEVIKSIDIVSVRPEEAAATIEPLTLGREYRLWVKPNSGSRVETIAVAGIIRFKSGPDRSFTVFAIVR